MEESEESEEEDTGMGLPEDEESSGEGDEEDSDESPTSPTQITQDAKQETQEKCRLTMMILSKPHPSVAVDQEEWNLLLTPRQRSASDGLSNSRSSHQQRRLKTTQLYRACLLIHISGQRIHYTWENDPILYLVETKNMSPSWKQFLNCSRRRPVDVSVSIAHGIPGKNAQTLYRYLRCARYWQNCNRAHYHSRTEEYGRE
jgi:hypothetical protein